jgi:poly(beta-D-mannuronate) C5 epimerase
MGQPIRPLTLACALALAALAARPACASIRWEPDNDRIVVRGQGVTLTSLKAADPSLPLQLVDPAHKVWLLNKPLVLADGAQLVLHGSAAGGDVDELRLRSDNQPGAAVASISADWGSIEIHNTRVNGWDTVHGEPDAEYGQYGRAFLRARSRLATDGVRRFESRMDIADSELAYLGSAAPESFGLVWKVVSSDNYVFDLVHVHGSLLRSRIHHNYFGAYSFGAHNLVWRGNQVYQNVLYGLAPHNHSDGIVIEDNDIHDNGAHGVMLYNQCDHALIRNNRLWANAKNGIVLRRGSNWATLEGNRAFANGDSGIALFASDGSTLRKNVLLRNGRSGVQLSSGTSDAVVEDNELGYNGGAALYVHRSSEKPEEGDDARPARNLFAGNVVYGSAAAVRVADGDRNRFERNLLQANGTGFEFSVATSDTVGADNVYAFGAEGGPAAAGATKAAASAPSALGFFGLVPARAPRPSGYCGGSASRMLRYEPGHGLRFVIAPCGAAPADDPRPPERLRDAAFAQASGIGDVGDSHRMLVAGSAR